MLLAATLLTTLLGCLFTSAGSRPAAPATPPAPAAHLADLTGDGAPDLVTVDAGGRIAVSVHAGGRRYDPVVQELPVVAARDLLVDDLDGDGVADVYLVGPGPNLALLGDGTGRLREATAALGLDDDGHGVAVARRDVDADGLADVIVHNAGGDALFWAEPAGGFTRAEDTPRRSAVISGGDGGLLEMLVATLARGAVDPSVLGDGLDVVLDRTADGRPVVSLVPAAGGGVGGGPGDGAAFDVPGAAPALGSGGTVTADGRAGGLLRSPGVARRAAPPVALLPGVLDELFVNDGAGEVDAADVADGSLAGADVSTGSGDVTHTGGRTGLGTPAPDSRLHVVDTTSINTLGGALTGAQVTVGDPSSTSLMLDNNEVQARFDTEPTTLYLNFWGGDVHVADGGGEVFLGGADHEAGYGVFAAHNAAVGTGKALYCLTQSPTGYAAWFEGGRSHFDGDVGIGTPAPSERLTVVNDDGFLAGGFYSTGQTGGAGGLHAETLAPSGAGVVGYGKAFTGTNVGVHGRTNSPQGRGVWAEGASPTSTALRIEDGAEQVAGAGVWTQTPVFVAEAGPGNILFDTQGREAGVLLDHPLLNGDPDALVLLTQQTLLVSGEPATSSPGGSDASAGLVVDGGYAGAESYDFLKFVSVAYSPSKAQWFVAVGYPDAGSPNVSLAGRRFHVAVYKP